MTTNIHDVQFHADEVQKMKELLAELGVSAQCLDVSNIRRLAVDELRAFAERHAAATGSAELSLVGEVLYLRYAVDEYAKLIEGQLAGLQGKLKHLERGKRVGGRRHRRR